MQENPLKRAINFFQKYWLLFGLVIIVGNVLIWNKLKNTVPVYEYSFKIRVKAQYYDNSRTVLQKMAEPESWREKNIFKLDESHLSRIASIRTDSYRNEDIYILEFILSFTDSTDFSHSVNSALSFIHKDNYFKEQYFDQLEFMNDLESQYHQLMKMHSESSSSSSQSSNSNLPALFDLKLKLVEIYYYKSYLSKEFELVVPPFSDVHFVRPDKLRVHLIATFLFFIAGFFIAIVIDQLRTRNK